MSRVKRDLEYSKPLSISPRRGNIVSSNISKAEEKFSSNRVRRDDAMHI